MDILPGETLIELVRFLLYNKYRYYYSKEVKKRSWELLSDKKNHHVVDRLIPFLTTADKDTRKRLISFFGGLKDFRTVEPLIELLNTRDKSLRNHVRTQVQKMEKMDEEEGAGQGRRLPTATESAGYEMRKGGIMSKSCIFVFISIIFKESYWGRSAQKQEIFKKKEGSKLLEARINFEAIKRKLLEKSGGNLPK